jgi:hypothetical protein
VDRKPVADDAPVGGIVAAPVGASHSAMSVSEAIGRIEALNRNLARFWRAANGWAPIETAGLLSKSRLDWQVSLSRCLRLWIRKPPDRLEDGELILAWANLGSLTEGTMRLFLSVFYHDYQKDIDGLKAAGAYHHKKQEPISPDGLLFDVMRVYFKNRELLGAEFDTYVELVQQRRNAIHAYKDRPIGDDQEFQAAVLSYLMMLREVNTRLPYPDEICAPSEI